MASSSKTTLLGIDDDGLFQPQVDDIIQNYYDLVWVSSVQQAKEVLSETSKIGAIIMRSFSSSDSSPVMTQEMKKAFPKVPIVFYDNPGNNRNPAASGETSSISREEAASRFVQSIRLAVDTYLFASNPENLVSYAEETYGMIGASRPMRTVYELIRKMSRTNSKAMILGETGTGKELVARAIHFTSKRKEMRFAILNCNHKTPELVESELFGHTRGSFTGAVNDRPGIFEYAHGGTIFLDEIGDLDLSTQAKLLRVLETGEYQKVGTEEMQKTEIRVLCATHKNLEHMVQEGNFRQDLYFRLKGVTILMPPLRDRKEDIALLIEKSARRFCETQGVSYKYFAPDVIDFMVAYDWPGNVRQLIDTVESLIVLAESDLIIASDVKEYLNIQDSAEPASDAGLSARVRQFERLQILNALRKSEFNISATARELRLDRTNLRRKIKMLDIEVTRPGKSA